MKLVNAESTGCIAQKLSHHPVEYLRLAQVMALDHVAQQHHVHIGPQQLEPVARVQSLRFRKTSVGQVIGQVLGELRALGLGKALCRQVRFTAGVSQHFAKAEREDNGLHGSAAHAGSHFSRQQTGGRTRQKELDVFTVQQTPGK